MKKQLVREIEKQEVCPHSDFNPTGELYLRQSFFSRASPEKQQACTAPTENGSVWYTGCVTVLTGVNFYTSVYVQTRTHKYDVQHHAIAVSAIAFVEIPYK